MHTTYRTETHEKRAGDVTLTVSNIIPVYLDEEKTAVKKMIKTYLYEIFGKYSSVRSKKRGALHSCNK